MEKARQLANSIPDHFLKNPTLVDFERLTELHFQIGLIFFLYGNYQKATRHFKLLVSIGKINYNLTIHKASRLLYIIIHYELKNISYLDYEIRSYKRTFQKDGKVSMIERLVLLVVKFDPRKKSLVRKAILWKKLSKKVEDIEKNKYEKQLLKYFDFMIGCIKSSLCHKFNWMLTIRHSYLLLEVSGV